MKLIPVREYTWTDDYSFMRTLTCRNHPTARYLTKNPFRQGIHIIKLPEGDIPRSITGECQCPFADMAVVVKDFIVEIGPQKATTDSATVAAQAMAYELEGWMAHHASCVNFSEDGCDEENMCATCAAGADAENYVELFHCIAHFGHGFGHEIHLPFKMLIPDGKGGSVAYQITQEN